MHTRSHISPLSFLTRTNDSRTSQASAPDSTRTSRPFRRLRTRESDAPLCNQCGDQMVRLGLSVACPYCGNALSHR